MEGEWQRKQTLKTIREEYPQDEQQDAISNFEKIHKDYVAYNESLFSFDNYTYDWHVPSEDIDEKFITPADVRKYILTLHQKWNSAIAISWRGMTIIGGWVAS